MFINLTELEDAINYWRSKSPSVGDALELCEEVSALSKPYAILILQGGKRLAIDHLEPKAIKAWNAYLSAVNKP